MSSPRAPAWSSGPPTQQRGRFVAIADASLFINNMLELPGNRNSWSSCCASTAASSATACCCFLGASASRAARPRRLDGAPLEGGGVNSVDNINRGAGGSQPCMSTGSWPSAGAALSDAVLVGGLLFCLAALALLLRYLPTASPTQDERFAQPPRPPETGLHASIVRYMLGAGQAVRWGYVYPATLLREEVLARIEPFLGATRHARRAASPASPSTRSAVASASGSARRPESCARACSWSFAPRSRQQADERRRAETSTSRQTADPLA